MDNAQSTEVTRRPFKIAVAAVLLLTVAVGLGATLGFLTRAQFAEVEDSWSEYSGGAERKGILISSIRGYLGYGGIIHNFKNYVLRQHEAYLIETRRQIDRFNELVTDYRVLPMTSEEEAAVSEIVDTIRAYERMLPTAIEAAEQGWPATQTDALVRVDDTAAIDALHDLEQIWREGQEDSGSRIGRAVQEGQQLIWIGFASIFALVLAALGIGFLLLILIQRLREAVTGLASELAERQRLERSESRLATAVEQSPATILITGTDARIQYANAKFEELTGWSLEEIWGKTPAFLQSGNTNRRTYDDIRNRLEAGQSWQGVFRNIRKDRSSYWAETTILPLLDQNGVVQSYIGIGEDITEKRQARDQVVRAQKLEAVGQLAGGVAHDFNNILTTIIGACHLAAMDAPEGSDLAAEIEQIDIAARRAQALVNELLTFARREPGESRPVNLGEIIGEVTRLLKASLPPTVSIVTHRRPEPLDIVGDPTHLHQIVMNLCRNAAEAIAGENGVIEVSVLPCSRIPDGLDQRREGWVDLVVRDDGPGMTEDILAHLFEPFFTTKPLGKGSGLGLAVVYGLVDDMGGQIAVDSRPGGGSRFTVTLPRTSVVAAAAQAEPLELPRGTERLILIDDEAEVAGTFRRILTRLGYQVEAFTGPLVALERFRTAPGRFDLVISDMVMPELSGEDLVCKFRELRADIPVIFCSAYKPERILLPGAAPEILNKPIEPGHLARRVRELLDEGCADGS